MTIDLEIIRKEAKESYKQFHKHMANIDESLKKMDESILAISKIRL